MRSEGYCSWVCVSVNSESYFLINFYGAVPTCDSSGSSFSSAVAVFGGVLGVVM